MKILQKLFLVMICLALTACGMKDGHVEEPAAIEEEDPCADGHTWAEATYRKPKTCKVCGKTEGKPLKAALSFVDFVREDEIVDLPLQDKNDENKKPVAKVWFDEYRVFDSDEYNEPKEGYEYRSVVMHIAQGDRSEYTDWQTMTNFIYGDYYEDRDSDELGKQTVIMDGKEYEVTVIFTDFDIESVQAIPECAEKFGWDEDDTVVYITNCTVCVPKGFDGMCAGYYDQFEYQRLEEGKEFWDTEDWVLFRFD